MGRLTRILALVLGLIFAHDHTLALMWLIPTSFFAAGKFLPLFALTPNSIFNTSPQPNLVMALGMEHMNHSSSIGRINSAAVRPSSLLVIT